ncbi:MAG: 2-amino-4-hydroxy-6-hydroxymethyldihydropteridine diphosphokinase [Psychrosphaera sp.]|nr:2-amino-4-hydroxy-6-hydroxymethyldihydropteridine diphosphokinase [Psychrosphaera sp.]
MLSGISQLKTLPDSQFIEASPLYHSKPMGPADQPDYINAVVAIDTQLSPLDLLDKTQKIENDHGRVRKDNRWGPRTLDLDILLYGQQSINEARLQVPHYGMREREFVLYPLYDLQPELVFADGCELAQLLTTISLNGMTKHSI